MNASPEIRARVWLPPWAWDGLGVLLVVASAFIHGFGVNEHITSDHSVVGWIAALAPAAAVPFRRRLPWAVLAVSAVCFGVLAFTGPLTPLSSAAVAIAVYTIAVGTDRRTAILTTVITIGLLAVVITIGRGAPLPPEIFQLVLVAFGAALGDAVRTRRAYIEEITARAVHAEQTREAEASRRVAEDRLRIARDLHDVVAHQITVISLNAGVASSALESRPEVAREALATIRGASRHVLAEIGDLLATLRLADDTATRPAVGLDLLPALAEEFERSGLHVTRRVEGDLSRIPAAIDAVAYRVLQEALTNALKHGSEGHAHVWVSVQPGSVRLSVTNPVSGQGTSADAGGHGLLGMRERVASVRGTMTAVREGTTYRLACALPLREDA